MAGASRVQYRARVARRRNLLILSRSKGITTTRRLTEAARARGVRPIVVNPLDCELLLDGRSARVLHAGKPLGPIDVCIPRIAQSVQGYGLAVLSQLGLAGVTLVNGPDAIALTRNKMRCMQLLSSRDIGIPATAMAQNARDMREMASLVGGVPVIVKLIQGGERQGVMICESTSSLEAAIEAVLGLGESLMIQQYVRGRDVRALVVGGSVVAAVRRIPRPNRLTRTLGRGARFEAIELPASVQQQVVAAARVVGLEVAAVDLLLAEDGPRIFELSSSPGIGELEEASGVDVAAAIVDHALALADARRARKLRPLPEPPAPPPAQPTLASRRRRTRRAGS